MAGDDGLTKIILGGFIVVFIACAGMGFMYMSRIGKPEDPNSLVTQLASKEEDLKATNTEIESLRDQVAKEKERIAKVEWETAVELDQKDRLSLTRSNYITDQNVRETWVNYIKRSQDNVRDYLENGDPVEPDGGYGYQPLARRKDLQEREHAESISKLDASIDDARNELTKANNRYTRRYEDKRNKRSRLETALDQAKDELQKASQREPSDTHVNVDGVVLATDIETRQIVINIGENQGVKRGMRFEVFRVHQGGERSRKGFIDVRTTDRETATCIILEQDIKLGRCPSCGYTAKLPEETFCTYCTGSGQGLHVQRLSASPKMTSLEMNPDDPIVVGDYVQNPFFAPGKNLRFAVKGEPLSIQFKNENLLDAVRWHGGSIDAEIGAGTDVLLAGKWAIEETRRARELGIEILHHYDVFDFLRN